MISHDAIAFAIILSDYVMFQLVAVSGVALWFAMARSLRGEGFSATEFPSTLDPSVDQ